MRTQTRGEFEIEDLLGHPAELIEELRTELSECEHPGAEDYAGDSGSVKVVSDPKRDGFYEVQSPRLTYYIHVIPGSGKVLLLAAWPTA